jgi:hypothetical protein
MKKITKRQLQSLIRESCGDVALVEPEIYGHGGKARLAKSQLFQIATDAADLHDLLEEEDELPEWVQSKIAVMANSMDAVFDHVEYKSVKSATDHAIEMDDFVEPHASEEDFSFTGDVENMPGADAFAVGLEAGRRGLK